MGRRSRAGRIVGVAVKTLVPIVILGVAGLAFGYLRATRPQVKTTPIQERVWLVGAVTAKRTTVRPTLVLYGKIVAGREVELRPLVAGPVIRVGASFADGGLVRKGDALVVIDPFEYHVAVIERTAQLVEARAKLRQIKTDLTAEQSMIKFDTQQIAIRRRDLARRVDLLKRRSGTEKSLDDARWSLNEQERQLANRRKTIESLQSQAVQQQAAIDRAEVALRRAQRDLHDTTLKAPFDGVLREISIAVGKRVGVGDKVARLSDAGWLEADFQVTDRQYGRLVASGSVVGRKVVVIWKAGDKTFRYPATIRRVSGRVASDSGGIDLFARLDHTDLKTVLRPGVFVQVQLADVPYVAVFRLPDEAVQAGNIVYVVKNGRLQARTVKIVGRIDNDVLVRGALTPGERVVARLFPEIGPGVRVQVP
jgi:multidrug efflux system membrane fusion protein